MPDMLSTPCRSFINAGPCKIYLGLVKGCASVFLHQVSFSRRGTKPPHSQYVVVQADKAWIAEEKVEVFQRLRQPERLHFVKRYRRFTGDILYRGSSVVGSGGGVDGLKHVPAFLSPVDVAGDAPHDEDGFDGLGSVGHNMVRVHHCYRAQREPSYLKIYLGEVTLVIPEGSRSSRILALANSSGVGIGGGV